MLHESQPEGMEVWFTTHPPSEERIQNVAADVAKLSAKAGLRKDSAAFQAVKKRVAAYLASKPKPAKRFDMFTLLLIALVGGVTCGLFIGEYAG